MDERELDLFIERLKDVFNRAMRKLNCDLVAGLEGGLTNPQFFVLQLLDTRGGCTVSELAEEIHVQPSAITALVDRLVKSGYVLRERDEQDRRIVLIRLSDEGRDIFKKSQENRVKIMKRYLSVLGPEELDQLLVIFEKMGNSGHTEEDKETHGTHAHKKRLSQ